MERGVSARELNISYFRETGIKMTKQVSDIREKVQKQLHEQESDLRHNWKSSREEFLASLNKWEAKSQEWIKEFALAFSNRGVWLFDRDGELRSSNNSHTNDGHEIRQPEEIGEEGTSSVNTLSRIKTTVINALSRLASPAPEGDQE